MPATEHCALLAALATRLSGGDDDALRAALSDAVAALGLRSAVVRDDTGRLLAVGGEVVHAVPTARDGAADPVVELPLPAGGTLTVVGSGPDQLPVLRALAALVGLSRRLDDVPARLVEHADAEADDVADRLHDGPVQELVFARFAADAAVRGGDPAAARDAVQQALQSLRRTLWMLRPRGHRDGGLPEALDQLAQRLAEAGRPPLVLDVDPAAALPPVTAATAYRLVQAASRAGETAVEVAAEGDRVAVRVRPSAPLPDLDRWALRARAVGATLTDLPDGVLVLRAPAVTRPHLMETEAIP